MNKDVRLLCLFLAGALTVASAGCRHKPAYSDIDPNGSSRNQNQNSDGQASTVPPETAGSQPAPPSQPPPAPPQTPNVKTPSFIDPATGDIKDLHSYPRAQRVNVQIGPVQGVNVMWLVLQTGDPMDKITGFYEQMIKNNHWTVIDRIIDPELSEWTMKKGEDDSAKVQVKKDLKTGRANIIIVRGEKLSEPGK